MKLYGVPATTATTVPAASSIPLLLRPGITGKCPGTIQLSCLQLLRFIYRNTQTAQSKHVNDWAVQFPAPPPHGTTARKSL
jgi:hypothetical protein